MHSTAIVAAAVAFAGAVVAFALLPGRERAEERAPVLATLEPVTA
jgi:hypothetical protein